METGGAIGINVGSKTTTMASVKAGGIEIILNGASNRYNPTMIGYGDNERLISDNAQAQAGRNHKNNIAYFDRFLGMTDKCEEQVKVEKQFTTAKTAFKEDGKLVFKVVNKGELLEVLPEQAYGAYLHMAKCYFTHENDKPDVVLSVPPYFSAVERQAVIDAAKIGGVNCLRLMNENTAVALNYGFFRRTEFDDKVA